MTPFPTLSQALKLNLCFLLRPLVMPSVPGCCTCPDDLVNDGSVTVTMGGSSHWAQRRRQDLNCTITDSSVPEGSTPFESNPTLRKKGGFGNADLSLINSSGRIKNHLEGKSSGTSDLAKGFYFSTNLIFHIYA